MVIRGGSSFVQKGPVFSKDGKRLLVCTSNTVTVFGMQTGDILTVLKGHKRLVTSVVVVPDSVCHCWTAGLDCTIRLWNYASGDLLRTIVVTLPVHSMVIPGLCKPREEAKGEGKRKALVAFLSCASPKLNKFDLPQGRVVCYNLTKSKQIPGNLAKTASPNALHVSPLGGMVGMTDFCRVWVWMVPPTTIDVAQSVPMTLLHHTQRLCALAFDISEIKVAAGDEYGRILIWENVGDRTFAPVGDVEDVVRREKRPRGVGVLGNDDASAKTTYRWHAHEVKSLVFTIDGAYLLSGGLEGVLVIWQLESGARTYLPRLGGQVVSIVPSMLPSIFAISCMDNSIKLVNIGTRDVEKSLQGIAPPFAVPEDLHPCTVSMEPVEGEIVVASHNLCLQFYDCAADKHVDVVQVTARNFINDSHTRDQGPSTCVTHVAFSPDGSSMATVDIRLPEQNIGRVSYLKFWHRQLGKPKFVINTMIDEPNEIYALSFRAGEPMAVSCSNVDFKVWVPIEQRKSVRNPSRLSWRCRSVGSYRHRPILAAAFSPDGSILAVAASEYLTIWNPATNSLIKVLSNGNYQYTKQIITHLAFVNQSNCLVAATAGQSPFLTVWEISTLSVRWSQYMVVEALSVHPVRPIFAVVARAISKTMKGDTFIALFDIESPTPQKYWTVRDGSGSSLFFNPVSQAVAETAPEDDSKMTDLVPSVSKLTYVTSGREFVLFDPCRTEEEPEQEVVRDVMVPEDVSAFTAVYGRAEQTKKKDAPLDILSALSRAPWGTLFNGPVHVLPPLSVIAMPFMDSLMIKRKEQS